MTTPRSKNSKDNNVFIIFFSSPSAILYKDTITINVCQLFIKMSFFIAKKMTEPDIRDMVKKEYKDFIVEKDCRADIEIIFNSRLKMNILDNKNKRYIYFCETVGNKVYTFCDISSKQLQLIIHNQISKKLGSKGFFLHGSSILVKNEVYLFLGASGAGKSTISQLLNGFFGTVFSDDYLIIKKQERGFYAYQLPVYENCFIEKSPDGFPIVKIFFLKKSKICSIKNRVNKTTVLEELMQQLKTEQTNIGQHVKLLGEIATSIIAYDLYFSLDRRELMRLF